jgi:tripartite-type tricarboxylate transporter receptor subunit TctC
MRAGSLHNRSRRSLGGFSANTRAGSGSNAVNATLYENLNFNFIRDIVPIAGIVRRPLVMVVNPSVPAKTVPEFIAYAKANPGKINMANPGIGSPELTVLDTLPD